MSSKTGKKGQDKPRASPKLNENDTKKLSIASNTSNISTDLDISVDMSTNSVKELQKMFEYQLSLVKTEFQSKVDTLYNVIKMKDDVIGKLQTEIGELKKSVSYLTKETSDNNKLITDCNKTMEGNFKKSTDYMQEIKDKTVDLEDRSRRCNLVFFNFKEPENNETEDCEMKIHNLLDKLGILSDEDVWIDRAHRLGRKRPHMEKPRPIIVKFSYYKHKEEIIKNASKFRDCEINVSEDFAKETLIVRRKLVNYGKDAKQKYEDPNKSIVNFKVNYKRLILTYSLNKKDPYAKKITRSYSLDNITDNAHWFVLKQSAQDPLRRQISGNQGDGYQAGSN